MTEVEYQSSITTAALADLAGLRSLPSKEAKKVFSHLRKLFGLAKGTAEVHQNGFLSFGEQQDYRLAREIAIEIGSTESENTAEELTEFFEDTAKSNGGRAFLTAFLHSVEIYSPGSFVQLSQVLHKGRGEFELTLESPGMEPEELQEARLFSARLAMFQLAQKAELDNTRPRFHAAMQGGWVNDPCGLFYDNNGELHIHFQHNPYASSWNHMHWSHGVLRKDGRFEALDISLEPRPADGYTQVFSGSIPPFLIPDPEGSGEMVRAAFFTAVGPGQSFYFAPPTVMAISRDPYLSKWETKRYQLTDANAFEDKHDQIHEELIPNRWDVRDPNVFMKDGKHCMIVAGSSLPSRQGGGAIQLLFPTDSTDLSKPWEYFGDTFRHELQSVADGGPGILECPSMCQFQEKDVLIFSSQRKPAPTLRPAREDEGNLDGYHYHQAVEYRVGEFDVCSGEFRVDNPHVQGRQIHAVDYGRAFYAPFAAPRPDRDGYTMVGWISEHDLRDDWRNLFEGKRGWNGCATIPRKLTLKNGALFVEPDEVIEQLRGSELFQCKELRLSIGSYIPLGEVDSNSFEIQVTVSLLGEPGSNAILRILADAEGENGMELRFNGKRLQVGNEYIPVSETGREAVGIRMIVDRSVIEVFTDGGRSIAKVVTPTVKREEDNGTEENTMPHQMSYNGSIFVGAEGGISVLRDIVVYSLGESAQQGELGWDTDRKNYKR